MTRRNIERTTFGVFTHFILFVICAGVLLYSVISLANTPNPRKEPANQTHFYLNLGLLFVSLIGCIAVIINMWYEIYCCWPCIKRNRDFKARTWLGNGGREAGRERDKVSLHRWPRRTKKDENVVKLEWLERRRSGSSKGGSGSGGDEWDEEVGFGSGGGGMGDWEGRIDRDERSRAEERSLVESQEEEGESSGSMKTKEVWVAREGEDAYMMRV